MQVDFELIRVARCKHLSGVTRSIGAPKWGIRSRLPLQLVGLKGLDNSQARGAPVRPVRLISPSSRKLWDRPSKGGAVRLARSKYGPDNPCVLVGDRNRCAVEPAPLPKLIDPLIVMISLVGGRSHDRPGAMDEQTPQMLVAPLRDAHQHGPISTGELPRDEADPGGKVATVLELRTIANSDYDCGRRLRTDALDLRNALACLAIAEHHIDLLVEDGDTAVEIAEEVVKLAERFAGEYRWGKLNFGM